MNAPLSPSERARIEAQYRVTVPETIAVQHIAQGVSATYLAEQYIWNGTHIVCVDAQGAKRRYAEASYRSGASKRAMAQISERRELVKAFHSQGFDNTRIAERVCASCKTVGTDLMALGLKVNKPNRVKIALEAQAEREALEDAQIKKIKALTKKGRPAKEIASALGVTVQYVSRLAQRCNVTLIRSKKGRP